MGRQLRRAGKLDLEGTVWMVPAGEVLGASTEEATTIANEWLGSKLHDRPRLKD